MASSSILRDGFEDGEIYKHLRKRPSSWIGMFDINRIQYALDAQGHIDIGGCSVKADEGRLICYPIDFEMPSDIAVRLLPELDISILHSLASFQSVTFGDIKSLLLYTHIPLIYEFLTTEEDVFMGSRATDPRFRRRIHRPSLVEVPRSSLLLERNERGITSNRRCAPELVSTVDSFGLRSLELPSDYDLTKTLASLAGYDNTLRKIGFPDNERGFELKFRKLGSFKANGFYSRELNIVIVDPRYPAVFYHELGHLVYDRSVPINLNLNANDGEAFAQSMYAKIAGADWPAA